MVSPADVFARLDSVDQRLDAVGTGVQYVIESQREQERLRGLKPIRWVASNVVAANTVTLGLNNADAPPVQQGYVWDLRIIAGKLSAVDTVAAFIGDSSTGGRLIGYTGAQPAALSQAIYIILIPKSSAILNAGETLTLTTSGTGNITSCNINAWSAPGEMVGKLF